MAGSGGAPSSSTSMALTTSNSNLKGAPNKATARSVPAFLHKLYSMVNDPNTDHLIRWSDDGDSFYVMSAEKFGHELLPRFFKHSNFGSFQRQLNMYGFHKVPHLHQGVLQSDNDDSSSMLEFSNTNFARAQPDLLILIKRQKAKSDLPVPANSSNNPSSSETALDLPSIITDLVAIRKHQTALSADIKSLQASNQTLWQEALASRDKNQKLNETVTKILRFLATVFGGQVVAQEEEDGGSADSSRVVVEEEEGEKDDGGKGKGKGKQVHRPATKRPRLLLEDVKGRGDRGRESTSPKAAEMFDLDDEEIEEIQRPLEEIDDLPRSATGPSFPSLTRTGSASKMYNFPTNSSSSNSNKIDSPSSASSRFTTLPSNTPTPVPSGPTSSASNQDPYAIPSDYLASILSGGSSPATLEALLQLQNGSSLNGIGSTGASAAGTTAHVDDYSRALLPSPRPQSASQSFFPAAPPSTSISTPASSNNNPFAPEQNLMSPSTLASLSSMFPSTTSSAADTALATQYLQQLNDQNSTLEELENDKKNIDHRTSVLENALSRLIMNLPGETREQLFSGAAQQQGAEEVGGFSTPSPGTAAASPAPNNALPGGTTGWDSSQALSDADLEKFLAQYVNTAPTDETWDPFEPGTALGVTPHATTASASNPFDQHQSSSNGGGVFGEADFGDDDDDDEDNFEDDEDEDELVDDEVKVETPVVEVATPVTATAGRGKKRKSEAKAEEVLEAENAASPAMSEGTRRSSRRKR